MRPTRSGVLQALLLSTALVASSPGHSAVETPVAEQFEIWHDKQDSLTIGVARPLRGSVIGFAASCERASGRIEALLFFGTVPQGKPVQVAAGVPNDRVERFGPVIRGGGREAGYHSPRFSGKADVQRFIKTAFIEGSLISNGHNSVWNRIPEERNAEARAALMACAN